MEHCAFLQQCLLTVSHSAQIVRYLVLTLSVKSLVSVALGSFILSGYPTLVL